MKATPIFSVFRALTLLTLASFFSWKTEAGSIARLVYDNVPGVTVASLTNASIFPDGPTFREQLDDFTSAPDAAVITGLQGKDNTGSNYGAYIRGYLEAPATGDYLFSIASDDASELWLSTNHTESARKRIVLDSSGGSTLFSALSGKVSLVRGEKYYIEVLHKQSGGGSYVQVGWRRPDGVPEVIPARHLSQHPLDAYLGRNEPNLPPLFNGTGLNGGDLPATVSATEGEDIVLELDVIAAQPTQFVWKQNGTPIAGENLSFLRLPRVSAKLSGQEFSATVSNPYGVQTSISAKLQIAPDRSPLTIEKVDHNGNPNQLRVSFSKPINVSNATNLTNYEIRRKDGTLRPIRSATLLSGKKIVQLDGDFAFQVDAQYTVTVSNIRDQAAEPNSQSPDPANIAFSFTGKFLGPIGFAAAGSLTNVTAVENRTAHFEAGLIGAKPWFFQWSKDGAAIPNATNNVLEVQAAASAVGQYRVSVSNEFSSAASEPVTLTVVPDLQAPKLISVRGLAGLNQIRLVFDEPIDPASATASENYRVAGVNIISAALSEDQTTIVLQSSTLQKGQSYQVVVGGLKDRAQAQNIIETTGSFRAEVDYAGEVLADVPIRYWRFTETGGNTVVTLASVKDALSAGTGTLDNAPKLGLTSLVPSVSDNHAIQLTAAAQQRIRIPNGSDLNATAGPWAKRTIQFWFRASSVPGLEASGLGATAGLWEEGAASRNIAVYLWRDPQNSNPDEVSLVFNALNNVASDGAGSPFGPPGEPAVFVQTPVRVGETYHVVAVFDGDSAGVNGQLILYVNGVEAGRAPGVGQIYNHTGDIQIGRGNGLIHTGESGDLGYFDGVLDEFAIYNKALPPERVRALYDAGLESGQSGGEASRVSVVIQNGGVVVTWDGGGQLKVANTVTGPYETVPSASSPYTENVAGRGQRFFQVSP